MNQGFTAYALSMKDWIPLLVAIVGIMGALAVYWWQKHLDRKNEILRERRELYRNFVRAVSRLELAYGTCDSEELKRLDALVLYQTLLSELYLVAPDAVVATLGPLNEQILCFSWAAGSEEHSAASNDLNEAQARTVYEMRRDTFGDTKISRDDVLSSFSKSATALDELVEMFRKILS